MVVNRASVALCRLLCLIICWAIATMDSRNRHRAETEYIPSTEKKPSRWKKMIKLCLIILFSIILLTFLLIWVVVPIVFWLSIGFQRLMIFMPGNSPKNPDFDHPETYGIEGVYNFHISVRDYQNLYTTLEIGAWLILHEDDVGVVTTQDVSKILRETRRDVLVYLHGVAANRAKPVWQYGIFRKEFMVLAIDHRGYGDSGYNVEMTELGMINDHVQVYDWLMNENFKNDVYYWGHSMGTALSCHTLRALKEQRNAVPKGLILEAPFTTLAEEIYYSGIGKVFKWLPYFNATVLKPLANNGLLFRSVEHILHVDCPIMIMHADDDNTIPCHLGEKLAHVALTERNLTKQGSVTLYIFESQGYGHNDITKDQFVPSYIRQFRETCQNFIRS